MPRLTKHSITRLEQRCGVSKKNAPTVAKRAFKRGITHAETHGNLHRFLDTLYLSQKKGTNMRIYGNAVYVFKEDVLITVINIPKNLMEDVNKIKEEKEAELRKAKKDALTAAIELGYTRMFKDVEKKINEAKTIGEVDRVLTTCRRAS